MGCTRVSASPAPLHRQKSGVRRACPSYLSPSKELHPNEISDNPTNPLERHYQTYPKIVFFMPILLSLVQVFLKQTMATCEARSRDRWGHDDRRSRPGAGSRAATPRAWGPFIVPHGSRSSGRLGPPRTPG